MFGEEEKDKALARAVNGEARPLDEVRSFTTPEGETVLAHATRIGMVPNIDHTPVPKVFTDYQSMKCFSKFNDDHMHEYLSYSFVQEVLGSYKLVFDAVSTPKKPGY